MGELQLIKRVRRLSNQKVTGRTKSAKVIAKGIGDDCAVLRIAAGCDALITTDFSLEEIHFRRQWHAADVVGHRCLARGLSDIAAMGGEALAAFLSLALPREIRLAWVDEFLQGFLRLAKRFGVVLAGGDTAESPNGILADIMVLGCVPRGEAVSRSGAQPGDLIYVTGRLGGSAAALERMRARPRSRLREQDYPSHFYPTPRIEVGRYLREHRLPSAMIDISDGLSTDLGHICEESGAGARIEVERIPIAVGANLENALHGGEDYELLFTAPAGKRIPRMIHGVAISSIGRMAAGRSLQILREGRWRRLEARGWEHFKG